MRFRALVYKELRECLPFVVGAVVVAGGFGFVILQANSRYGYLNFNINNHRDYSLNSFYKTTFLADPGSFLLTISIALGIALGIRQFGTEFFLRTWGFLLHRSVSRGTILVSKIFAGLISFVAMSGVWGLLFIHAHNRRYFAIPPAERVFWEGLIFVGFGFVSYLAISLAAMHKAKWYTIKGLSVALGIWMFFILTEQWQLVWGWITIAAVAFILLIQIIDTFLNREFE